MDYRREIIEYIKNNRVSTTEVADALDKSGSLPNITPINDGHFVVGSTRTLIVNSNSNYTIHKEIENLERGEVLYIKPKADLDLAYFGELVSKYTILYKGAVGIVIEGKVRDMARLKRENFPIWANGSNPVGVVNSKLDEQVSLSLENLAESIAICDDGGVVLIPPEKINISTYENLIRIEAMEDLWAFCLNTLKWSTFDIVVKKRYLEDNQEIPKFLLQRLGINHV